MNLRLLNALAMAAILAATARRRHRRDLIALLAAAAAFDAVVMFTLLGPRSAADQAVAMSLNSVQVTHIATSAVFPLLYPFLIVSVLQAPRDTKPGASVVPAGLAAAFLVTRAVSFVTSFYMRG